MTRCRALAALAALLVLLPLAPAHAVAPFGPTHHVTPNGCAAFVGATTTAGTTRGFTICNNATSWRFVQGSGSRWTYAGTPYSTGEDVLAVAIDGDRTWVVTANNSGTYLRSRIGGSYNAGRRLTTQRRSRADVAIVATGGKYHVVWSQETGTGSAHLWEIHTLGGNVAPRKMYGAPNDSNTREATPVLAYQPTSGRVVLAWSHALTQSNTSVLMSSRSTGAWATARTAAKNAWSTSIAVHGSTVAIGYGRFDGDVCQCGGGVSTGTTSGMTSARYFTNVWYGPRLAISNGFIGAVWRSRTSGEPHPARVATRVNGVWSERVLPSPDPDEIVGVAVVSGRLRFFARYGSFVGVRSQ